MVVRAIATLVTSILLILLGLFCFFKDSYSKENSSWLAKANRNIEDFRKSDLTIVLVDSKGNVFPNSKIKIKQLSNNFFGTAVRSKLIMGNSSDSEIYKKIFLDNFNHCVIENDLKWEYWNENQKLALDAIKWIYNRNISIRGHYLAWGPMQKYDITYKNIMSQQQYENRDIFKELLFNHINQKLAATKDYIQEWDAINHIVSRDHIKNQIVNQSNRKVLLNDYIKGSYDSILSNAKRLYPRDILYLNEGGILEGSSKGAKISDYYTTIGNLKRTRNVDGIGFMAHFKATDLPSLTQISNTLDKFSSLDLPMKITEFDLRFEEQGQYRSLTKKELDLQARFTENFIRLCYSKRSIKGFIFWGFWEGAHWYPTAALYDKQFNIKPNGSVLKKLMNEWKTDTVVVSNRDGISKLRVFQGRHLIQIKVGEKNFDKEIRVSERDTVIKFVIN